MPSRPAQVFLVAAAVALVPPVAAAAPELAGSPGETALPAAADPARGAAAERGPSDPAEEAGGRGDDPEADEAEGDDPAPELVVLDSIVVTAQKREERIGEVPVSMTVVPGEQMAELEIDGLVDLARFVPNFIVEEGTQGAALVMRGIGNNGGTNLGFDSPVGTFVDGVYYGRNNHAWLSWLDVERVEVLRGPQSTLFGMNTVAGAVSIVSAEPTDEREAHVRSSYGLEHGEARAEGVVSGPLTATLSGRLAVAATSHEGYFHNTFLDRDVHGNDDDGARLTLRWTPRDRLTVTTKLERLERFQDGLPRQLIRPTTDAGALARQLALDPDATFLPDLDTTPGPESRDLASDAVVVTAHYAFDDAVLTSLSSYTAFDGVNRIDLDASALPMGLIRGHEDFEQVSQELRLTSTAAGRLDWIGGLFYQDSTLTHDRLLDFRLAELVPAFAGTPEGGLQTYAGNFAQDFETASAFGRLEWDLRDDLRVVGGFRYSEETKRATSFFDWLVPGTTDPTEVLAPGTEAFGDADFVFHDLFGIERHADRGTYRESALLPDLKIQWQANDRTMLYAARTEGHKSGGFNDRDNQGINFSFGPESSTSYELGVRSAPHGGAARAAITLFRTEFEDMQVSVFDLDNLVFIVANAAKAVSQGVEANGVWRPAPGLTLRGAVGWLERARFVEFLVPCVAGPADPECMPRAGGDVRDEGGEDLNTPDLFLGLGADYEAELGPAWRFGSRIDVNYRSEAEDVVNRDGGIDSVAFVDARVALTWRERWSAALMGRNLTDERFVVTREAQLFAGSEQGEIRPPRTIAVQLGYRF